MPEIDPVAPMIETPEGVQLPIVRLTARGEIYGQATMTTFNYVRREPLAFPAEPITDQERVHLVSQFKTVVLANAVPNMSEDFKFNDVLFQQRNLIDAASFPMSISGPLQGQVNSEAETQTVAVVCSRYTDWRGKHGRGRAYWPAVPHANVESGRVKEAPYTGWIALAAAMLSALEGEGEDPTFIMWDPWIVASALRPGETKLRGAKIVRVLAHDILRNQRRREVGVGI